MSMDAQLAPVLSGRSTDPTQGTDPASSNDCIVTSKSHYACQSLHAWTATRESSYPRQLRSVNTDSQEDLRALGMDSEEGDLNSKSLNLRSPLIVVSRLIGQVDYMGDNPHLNCDARQKQQGGERVDRDDVDDQ